MASNNIESKVENLLNSSIEALGYELYDVLYEKEGKDYYLRIIIDKPEGIDINDCEIVNNEINPILDEADYIKEQYFLEVSSPGAERPLKKESDYQRALNEYIHVSLYQAVDGRKVYEGTMTDLTPDSLTLDYLDKTRYKTITLDRKKIAKARLAIKF